MQASRETLRVNDRAFARRPDSPGELGLFDRYPQHSQGSALQTPGLCAQEDRGHRQGGGDGAAPCRDSRALDAGAGAGREVATLPLTGRHVHFCFSLAVLSTLLKALKDGGEGRGAMCGAQRTARGKSLQTPPPWGRVAGQVPGLQGLAPVGKMAPSARGFPAQWRSQPRAGTWVWTSDAVGLELSLARSSARAWPRSRLLGAAADASSRGARVQPVSAHSAASSPRPLSSWLIFPAWPGAPPTLASSWSS